MTCLWAEDFCHYGQRFSVVIQRYNAELLNDIILWQMRMNNAAELSITAVCCQNAMIMTTTLMIIITNPKKKK